MAKHLDDSIVPVAPDSGTSLTELKINSFESVEPISTEFDNSHFINRELSLLSFNDRVLEQSIDPRHPLLERLKFLLIFSSNLDEFFEVRVARLKNQVRFGREIFGPDGLPPKVVLKRLAERCHELVKKQYQIFDEVLLPELAQNNIRFVRREDWTDEQRSWIRQYFEQEVAPIVSPIALDPAHPFPLLVNKSLNFIVSLKGKDAFGRESRLAIVPAPRSLPRLIKLPIFDETAGDNFVFLSAIIHENVDSFFHGMKATGCYQFRVTRNSDLDVDEKEVEDIAAEVKGKLFNRRFGHAVRIEVVERCPDNIVAFLLDKFSLSEDELYLCNGPVNLHRMFTVFSMLDRPSLEYPAFSPEIPEELTPNRNFFESIKAKDFLLLHPYSSFNPVLYFLRAAANDPAVMSIKQTLYRVGHDSEIADILDQAARNGKEVTVVIELKARFDEKENLALASRLQSAGAVVCYGVVGHKTHAKMLMVLRKEGVGFVRYVHLGTGNYHEKNARIYTDYSLFSSHPDLCEDVHNIFLQLTGMGKTLPMKQIFNAPFTLKKMLLKLIDGEIDSAREGKAARIIIKVNGLTDKNIIERLYMASQAGVKVDLLIRGMCSLRPGVEKISENIQVKSVIGRFLEHNRVFYFMNDEHQIYCSSADLMQRNLDGRIEICFPINSAKIKNRVLKDLELFVADEAQSWLLDASGNYQFLGAGGESKFAQQILLDKHCEMASTEH